MPPNKIPRGPIKLDTNALRQIVSDADAIVAAVRAHVEADVSIAPNTITYSLSKQQDNFAKVTISAPEGGGFYAYAKKVYGIWTVIVTGQDLPGKDIGKMYALPDDWYSQEY